jgi:hypothetical protein
VSRELAVIVPSRGRPAKVRELAQVFYETGATASLAIGVDLDDPELGGYRAAEQDWPNVEFVYGPRLRLGPTLNRMAAEAAEKTDTIDPFFAVAFMGDDHRPRTAHWDKMLVDALHDLGTGIVYGNDLHRGERLPTAVAMTSDIIRTLGYMVPPGMIHMYLDNFWLHLGSGIDRIRYLPPRVIEHMHPIAGKADWDERYAEVNDRGVYTHDERVFREYMVNQFETDCASIEALWWAA